MKSIAASLIALAMFAGAANAAPSSVFTDLGNSAPRSAFDQLADSAPVYRENLATRALDTAAQRAQEIRQHEAAFGVDPEVRQQRLGLRVLMTREDDRTLVLDERAAFANNNKADLFISLHANASVASVATGAEVFYLSLDGYSPEAQRVEMQEGAVLPSVSAPTCRKPFSSRNSSTVSMP